MAEQLILKGTLEGHVCPSPLGPPVTQCDISVVTIRAETLTWATQNGWVTSLATSMEKYVRRYRAPPLSSMLRADRLTSDPSTLRSPNMLLSGSRDKTLIIWNLTRDETQYGYPKRSLHGHSHMVSDCVCRSPCALAIDAGLRD